MQRLIDSEVAYQFLTDQLLKVTGKYSEGVNKGLNIARSAMRNSDAIPTIAPESLRRGQWVSVKDRLPQDNERILAYRPNAHPNRKLNVRLMWGWECKSKRKGVTHWMPLPELPEED